MDENKTLVDKQPIILQIAMVIGLAMLFGFVFTALGMMLISPIYGITGADTLIMKAQSTPDSIKSNFDAINALKFIQLMSSIGLFLIPAVLFALIKKMPGDYLKVGTPVKIVFVGLSVLVLLTAGPLVNILQEWNAGMKLPASMKALEDAMKAAEDAATKLTTLFLLMPRPSDFIFNLLVIGLIPAIAEEFFFRGVLQQLLKEAFKNAHVAIWVGAIIFSTFHFEFYGFVPRVLLGALLGYLFYWSGNIWVPIIGHFINNGGQVIADYLHQRGTIAYDIESSEAIPVYITIISTLLLAGVLYIAYLKRVHEPIQIIKPDSINSPSDTNPWQ